MAPITAQTSGNTVGTVLQAQGTQLLAQAVAAYRAALTVRTKEQLPQQ